MACALLARHGQPTLVILDRKPLLEQWRSRLQEHLGLAADQIGQLGGGRDRQTTDVDLAMAQGLARRGDLVRAPPAMGWWSSTNATTSRLSPSRRASSRSRHAAGSGSRPPPTGVTGSKPSSLCTAAPPATRSH
jgi:hypothetical protein